MFSEKVMAGRESKLYFKLRNQDSPLDLSYKVLPPRYHRIGEGQPRLDKGECLRHQRESVTQSCNISGASYLLACADCRKRVSQRFAGWHGNKNAMARGLAWGPSPDYMNWMFFPSFGR